MMAVAIEGLDASPSCAIEKVLKSIFMRHVDHKNKVATLRRYTKDSKVQV